MAPLIFAFSTLLLVACPGKDAGDDDDDESGEVDGDNDGSPAGEDCDDGDPNVSPLAEELCDGIDNDCDGTIDEDSAADAVVWCQDLDGDGYGGDADSDRACERPGDDWIDQCGDCDDGDTRFHPGAVEDDCTDPNDYNCDDSTLYADADEDGMPACQDCDDDNAAVHADAPEVCDGVDNDCNGLADDEDDPVDAGWWYQDLDGDGHGTPADSVVACDPGDGWAPLADDCDDGDPDIHPDADERCDPDDVDEDCDGLRDDDDDSVLASTLLDWYADGDDDGYGAGSPTWACEPTTADQVDNDDDCDDGDPAINPDAAEVCDGGTGPGEGTDEDCDGLIDGDDSDVTGLLGWYPDNDGDGYGDRDASPSMGCEDPSTGADPQVDNDADCDDGDDAISPDATEVCDAADVDEDCDGLADDADSSVDASTMSTWYPDDDGDGYGGDGLDSAACDSPGSGWGSEDGDCDDDDADVFPGAPELCDGIDQDCDDDDQDGEGLGLAGSWGEFTDITSTSGSGTARSPSALELSDGETLRVCEGTWYLQVSVGRDADAQIQGEGSRDLAVLDGADDDAVVLAYVAGTVQIRGVTLQGGAGYSGSSSSPTGGGVHASSTDALVLDDVVIADNTANYGGGVYASFTPLTITDSEIRDNDATYAGGGVYCSGSEMDASDSTFSGNTSGTWGGGAYVTTANYGDYALDGERLVFEDNASDDGSGLYVGGGLATITGERGERYGFFGHSGSAVYLKGWDGEAELSATNLDFGEPDTSDDNEIDLRAYVYGYGTPSTEEDFTLGDDESFSCMVRSTWGEECDL